VTCHHDFLEKPKKREKRLSQEHPQNSIISIQTFIVARAAVRFHFVTTAWAQASLCKWRMDSETGPLVKLVSAEGHEFYIHKKCAMVSGTIKAMLSGQFAESRGEVRFPEIPGVILERVVQYLYYKVRYSNSSLRVPNFSVEPEMSLELLMAANYLDC